MIISAISIRKATAADVHIIDSLIRQLAEYEKASPDQVHTTTEALLRYGFGEESIFSCFLAFWGEMPVGMALFFYQFSTWECAPAVYLEDLFVVPEYRRRGIGKELMKEVARAGIAKGATRMSWQVLHWNTPALETYKAVGAKAMDEWITMRLDGEQLHNFATDER